MSPIRRQGMCSHHAHAAWLGSHGVLNGSSWRPLFQHCVQLRSGWGLHCHRLLRAVSTPSTIPERRAMLRVSCPSV